MSNVKNKKCIDNLCKKSIFANARRNVILAFAIILSTVMLTTLFTVGGSILKSVQKSTMYQVGTEDHAGYKFMTQEEYDLLSKDLLIRNLSYDIIIGEVVNPEFYEDYTEIRFTTEKGAISSFSLPEVGRLPEEKYEVATCTQVLDDLGVSHEIGQSVHLSIWNGSEVYEGDFTLCGYWDKPASTMANQIYVSKEFQEEYAPAWMSDEDRQEHYDLNSYSGSISSSFNFRTSVNIDKQLEDLTTRLGFGENVSGGTNWAYLAGSVDLTSVILVVFLLVLIMGSGYLIIYNIFYIAVSSDIRYYGLLKTVGTTNKQLKRLVVKQASALAFISIPIGLLLGYLVSIVVLPLITESMLNDACKIEANIWIFILSAFFSWITIRISCIKPCKVVRNVSPVEAVRYNEYSGSNLASDKKIRKVTPFTMAGENLKRNRKKSAVVILSLALSILMINVTVSITKSFDKDKYVREYTATDFFVGDGSLLSRGSFMSENYEGVTDEDIEELSNIPGITEIGAIYMKESLQHMEGSGYDRLTALYEEHPEYYVWSESDKPDYDMIVYENKTITSHIYGVDKIVFDEMAIDAGTIDWEKFQSGKYVIVSSSVNGSDHDEDYAFYKVGDKVNVCFSDGSKEEYEVMAIGDVSYAMGPQHTHSLDVYFTIPASEFRSHEEFEGAMKLFFNVDDEYEDATDEILTEYCDELRPTLGYRSRAFFLEDFRGMVRMFLIVGGALSAILALIGLLNFINLTYTSIHERKNELAVLRAVGMTRKQMVRMLESEGFIHIIITFALVLTVGMVLNYFLVNLLAGGMIMFSYKFVVWPVFACIPVFALVSVMVPRLISHR
ncbi:MAG: ABC transporter permease [Lachnospiraceae bacterium]|nr:ABC transporter permease [Lachnospiraceae bacterium]